MAIYLYTWPVRLDCYCQSIEYITILENFLSFPDRAGSRVVLRPVAAALVSNDFLFRSGQPFFFYARTNIFGSAALLVWFLFLFV